MKAKWIGLLLLIVVALGAVGYVWFSQSTQVTEISGYVGGEKIGLLEDEQVRKILKDKYRLSLDYNRAGSIEMVTTLDRTGQDFLFPSNQTALELFEREGGSPEKSQIVFNTPIVLYTHAAVAEALTAEGVFSQSGGVLTADMEQLVALMESGAQWSDVGLPELYGSVTVGTTDPAKSNSGNMFAGLLANVLCGGSVGEEDLPELLPRLQALFQKLGYMESSSSDLFDQFLKTGMGAKPLIAGYESQLLEFAVQEPETWEQIQGDIVLVYPTPTVWSSHVFIAGLDLSAGTFAGFILLLAVTMVAAPGVPGGAIMAALGLLESMLGFDETLCGLMIATYIAMDSFGTAANVTGDGAVAVIVDRIDRLSRSRTEPGGTPPADKRVS